MSVRRLTWASLVLLCSAALEPMAAQGARRFVGGGAGLVQPLGSFGEVERIGWHAFGTAVVNVSTSWAVTLDAVFGQVGHADGVDGHSRMIGATANVAYLLAGEHRRVRPLVFIGGGLYGVSVYVPSFGTGSTTKLAFDAGGAVMVGPADRRRWFITARYVSVRTAPEATSFFPISAGVVFPLR
jgi:hypothetical protein